MISDKVQRALENCFQFGDSDELYEKLGNGCEAYYVSWGEFELPFPGEGEEIPDHREDLGALLHAGAVHVGDAMEKNLLPFFTKDDGNGCHVFYAPSEDVLVKELLRVGAEMEDETRAVQAS